MYIHMQMNHIVIMSRDNLDVGVIADESHPALGGGPNPWTTFARSLGMGSRTSCHIASSNHLMLIDCCLLFSFLWLCYCISLCSVSWPVPTVRIELHGLPQSSEVRK